MKNRNRFGGHVNESYCTGCGSPTSRCWCAGRDPEMLLPLPGEPAPTRNAGYTDEDGGDVLPLPGEHTVGTGFAAGDRVTWVTRSGRRRSGTIVGIDRDRQTAELDVPERVQSVRVSLDALAPADEENRPVSNAKYRGEDCLPY